jgi:hypothetical protein
MAINPNVIVPQVQQAVKVPLPADDPALFGASLLVIGCNVDTIMFLGTHGMNTAKNCTSSRYRNSIQEHQPAGNISSRSTC